VERLANREIVLHLNELHNAARGGDAAARDRLFEVLSVRLRLFAHQRIWHEEDADDVAQSALMTIAREYTRMDFESSFAAWAYRVLNNRILGYLKSKRAETRKLERLSKVAQPAREKDCDPAVELRLLDCLKKIGRTNKRYARILNLHYQGYTTEEVCRKLKMRRNHAYVTLFRARSLLVACLETGDVS
jgi:RNA polymerase sigma factor (sigma-70 family)